MTVPVLQRCHTCGAVIFFATTAAGKKMPLDGEPHPEGNVALGDNGTCTVLGRADAGDDERPRYRSHFVSCTDPGRHRRRKP